MSLQVVDGKPAIAYYDTERRVLKYAHATDPNGSGFWNAPVTVIDGGTHASLQVVDGHPAISYFGGGTLKYVRATTPDGSSWDDPSVEVDSGGVGQYTSLQVVITSVYLKIRL